MAEPPSLSPFPSEALCTVLLGEACFTIGQLSRRIINTKKERRAKEGDDLDPCLLPPTPTLFLKKRQPLPHPTTAATHSSLCWRVTALPALSLQRHQLQGPQVSIATAGSPLYYARYRSVGSLFPSLVSGEKPPVLSSELKT